LALDSRIAEELQATYQRLDDEGKLLSNAQLDAAYQVFRSRFGLERLQALDGEELLLAMHSRGDNSSLVYWLEFKQDEEFPTRMFGSISGGSAHKFGVFYRQEKAAWMGGSPQKPQEITLQQAIQIARTQRDELVRAAELLRSLPDRASDEKYVELQRRIDQVAPTVGDSAWGHKYLSLLFPEKLDDFHNPEYQRFHLIRLLQMPPQESGRYVCAGRFVTMAEELGLRLNHLTHVVNERDGRNPYGYWRVGTREGTNGASQWEAMKAGSYVGIGWDETGDLSSIAALPNTVQRKQALKQLLTQSHPDLYPTEGAAGSAAGEIRRLVTEIPDGDLVLAADGATILGVGRVTGPYYYAPDGKFRHRRPVTWLSLDSWKMPISEQLLSTVRPLGKHPENLLEAERWILGAQPIVPPPLPPQPGKPQPTPPLDETTARIAGVLQRKGQVILYGPPGTGKTYWAEIATQELAARSWFGKAFADLSDQERGTLLGSDQPGGAAVRMCSFHPAYGYEDFLEGYRPTAVHGQMLFELRDGIFKQLCQQAAKQPTREFFLIIDEINRGDIPRIFGELLTVMEKNKRGKTVLLPLTGAPFTVPPNVRIIGTMNTADRSIALLDAALRRRFGFVELMPDSLLLGDGDVGGLPLRKWFEALNESVVRHMGRDGRNLQVGHSYFLSDSGQPVSEVSSFARILAEDIIPLLQEYCYEDYSVLAGILGKEIVDAGKQRLNAELFAPDRGSDLIDALLSNHPDLATYMAPAAAEEGDTEDELDEDKLEDGAEGDSTGGNTWGSGAS
jgi:5-methylcytosine-specific restriction protein B